MPRLTTLTSARPPWQQLALSVGQINVVAGNILAARRAFLTGGDGASALETARIYKEFNDALNRLARETAQFSEREIKGALKSSASGRPDTGRAGQTKLKDTIVTEWAKTTPSAAYVGIAVVDELNKAVSGRGKYGNVPYWRVQEYGHHYSHVPKGFFFGPGYGGGGSRPDPAQAGTHPLFVPSKKGGAFRSPPVVPEREFLKSGRDRSIVFWRAGVDAASATAIVRMERLVALRGGATVRGR